MLYWLTWDGDGTGPAACGSLTVGSMDISGVTDAAEGRVADSDDI